MCRIINEVKFEKLHSWKVTCKIICATPFVVYIYKMSLFADMKFEPLIMDLLA